MPLNNGRNRFARPYRGGNNYNRTNNRFRYKRSDWSQMDLLKRIQDAAGAKQTQAPHVEYVTKNTFEDFAISTQLKQNIYKKGYKIPTPIQDQAIPAIINGSDIIGVANTGTGKTAAFLIPLIDKVNKDRTQKVLIVSPTRELAEQSDMEFRGFANGMGQQSVLCIGGKGMGIQISLLRRGPAFVIGTPGRLKDLIKRGALNLAYFNNVVLDETDRMVDIGFIEEIKYFISLLPAKRQSLFFSATIGTKIKGILEAFVKNPVSISVKTQETAENVQQDIVKTPAGKTKIDYLHELLSKESFSKVLVFGNTKWAVQKLADDLVKKGMSAGAIHGNKNQSQRQAVLNKFKTNQIKVLIATDVASRGLDIKDVSHVINYELPEAYDEYVHRIGRTGRANKKGIALTFID